MNLLVSGLYLRINDSGLFAWIGLTLGVLLHMLNLSRTYFIIIYICLGSHFGYFYYMQKCENLIMQYFIEFTLGNDIKLQVISNSA